LEERSRLLVQRHDGQERQDTTYTEINETRFSSSIGRLRRFREQRDSSSRQPRRREGRHHNTYCNRSRCDVTVTRAHRGSILLVLGEAQVRFTVARVEPTDVMVFSWVKKLKPSFREPSSRRRVTISATEQVVSDGDGDGDVDPDHADLNRRSGIDALLHRRFVNIAVPFPESSGVDESHALVVPVVGTRTIDNTGPKISSVYTFEVVGTLSMSVRSEPETVGVTVDLIDRAVDDDVGLRRRSRCSMLRARPCRGAVP